VTNYKIVPPLTKNPTPLPAISMNLLLRTMERDLT
jgi:hypothetical protein